MIDQLTDENESLRDKLKLVCVELNQFRPKGNKIAIEAFQQHPDYESTP